MLETVAAGLILAAVSGITYLAYKHPSRYRRILFPVVGLILASQIVVAAWSMGVSRAFTTVYRFIDSSKWNEAEAVINSITPRWWLVSVITFGSLVYLAFLRGLPLLIHEKKEPKRPKEKD